MKSSINVSKENNKESENAKPNPILENINSKYILSKIYDNMTKKKKLQIVKYNKKIQNRINLSVNDYKEYCEIEIEIIPKKYKYGKFIYFDKIYLLFMFSVVGFGLALSFSLLFSLDTLTLDFILLLLQMILYNLKFFLDLYI